MTHTVIGLNSKKQYYAGGKEDCYKFLITRYPTMQEKDHDKTGAQVYVKKVLPEPMMIKDCGKR